MLVRSDYTRLQFRLLQLHYVLLNPDAGGEARRAGARQWRDTLIISPFTRLSIYIRRLGTRGYSDADSCRLGTPSRTGPRRVERKG